jgi:hypothetical protein
MLVIFKSKVHVVLWPWGMIKSNNVMVDLGV